MEFVEMPRHVAERGTGIKELDAVDLQAMDGHVGVTKVNSPDRLSRRERQLLHGREQSAAGAGWLVAQKWHKFMDSHANSHVIGAMCQV